MTEETKIPDVCKEYDKTEELIEKLKKDKTTINKSIETATNQFVNFTKAVENADNIGANAFYLSLKLDRIDERLTELDKKLNVIHAEIKKQEENLENLATDAQNSGWRKICYIEPPYRDNPHPSHWDNTNWFSIKYWVTSEEAEKKLKMYLYFKVV